MESKQILLINDLPGYGKVALAAMMPVLAHMGHILYTLPTALVSNTLGYGQFEIIETTEYIKNIWGSSMMPLPRGLLYLKSRLS